MGKQSKGSSLSSFGPEGKPESRFVLALHDRMPLVTVWNPQDPHPEQKSAMRIPLGDSWRSQVKTLVELASLVVVALHEYSPGLFDELEILAASEASQRTVIVIDRSREDIARVLPLGVRDPGHRRARLDDAELAPFKRRAMLDDIDFESLDTSPVFADLLVAADRDAAYALAKKAQEEADDGALPLAQGLAEQAVARAQRAEEDTRWRIQRLLGRIEVDVDCADRGIERIRSAVEYFEQRERPADAGYSQAELARALMICQPSAASEAMDAARASLRWLELADDPVPAAHLLALRTLAGALLQSGDRTSAAATYSKLLEAATRYEVMHEKVRAYTGLGICAAHKFDAFLALDLFERALLLARESRLSDIQTQEIAEYVLIIAEGSKRPGRLDEIDAQRRGTRAETRGFADGSVTLFDQERGASQARLGADTAWNMLGSPCERLPVAARSSKLLGGPA